MPSAWISTPSLLSSLVVCPIPCQARPSISPFIYEVTAGGVTCAPALEKCWNPESDVGLPDPPGPSINLESHGRVPMVDKMPGQKHLIPLNPFPSLSPVIPAGITLKPLLSCPPEHAFSIFLSFRSHELAGGHLAAVLSSGERRDARKLGTPMRTASPTGNRLKDETFPWRKEDSRGKRAVFK